MAITNINDTQRSATSHRITAQDHQKNLESLALLTPEQMDGMTTAYLRKLLSSISVYSVERDGIAISTSRARKAELITAIYEMTTKPRVLAQVELTELSQDDIRASLAGLTHDSALMSVDAYSIKLFNELREYTVNQWDTAAQLWKLDTQYPKTLSLGLFVWLESYRTVDGSPLGDNTKVSYASRMRNDVRRMIREHEGTASYATQLDRHYSQFKGHNEALSKELITTVKASNKERSDFRHSNSQAIDPTLILARAEKILFDVVAGQQPRWGDVSIALALVTGRRQSEIHATAKFVAIDGQTHQVKFEGQLKKRDAETDTAAAAYTIPTLVSSTLVLEGHAYLIELGKYYHGDHKLSHKRVSNDIAKWSTQKWYESCLPDVVNYHDEAGREVKVRTYHKLRDIYALVALRNQTAIAGRMGTSDSVKFLQSVLGHGEGGNAYQAYDANFYLV